MSLGASRFYNSIDGVADLSQRELVAHFVYYLTVEAGADAASAKAINAAFEACDLVPPARVSAYLSEGAKSRPPTYVKQASGYKLERNYKARISKGLGAERIVAQTSSELRKLEGRLAEGPKRAFLTETIDCFEIGANRAAIVMCWLLAVDHLADLVVGKHLSEFNAELAKVKDRRIKVSIVAKRDDLNDIPEGKFIELLRAAGIISNDVRKLLDVKLGIRNSSAHPSGIAVKRSKAIDFIEDIIENVLIKYPL